jgi:hypothetical protein
MGYPLFAQKIEIIQKKYKIDPAEIAKILKHDKTTAWRWLGKPQTLSDRQQRLLVDAICIHLNEVIENLSLSQESFNISNILNFCIDIGLTKFEAATFTNQGLPIPDVFIDSVFNYLPPDQRKNLIGSYLLFRHDKEHTHKDTPYLQAYASIYSDELGRLAYEDSWAGDGDRYAQTYEGFVMIVGRITNVVGQRRRMDPEAPTEIFWQGLRRRADATGRIACLYGYVSDITQNDRLFADRMVLIRTDDQEVKRVRTKKEYYVTGKHVGEVAGTNMLAFLQEWSEVPIEEPR